MRPQTPLTEAGAKGVLRRAAPPAVRQALSSRPGLQPTNNTGHLPPSVSKVLAFSPAPQDLAGAHSCARGVGAGLSRPQTQRSLSAAGSFLLRGRVE